MRSGNSFRKPTSRDRKPCSPQARTHTTTTEASAKVRGRTEYYRYRPATPFAKVSRSVISRFLTHRAHSTTARPNATPISTEPPAEPHRVRPVFVAACARSRPRAPSRVGFYWLSQTGHVLSVDWAPVHSTASRRARRTRGLHAHPHHAWNPRCCGTL